MAPIEEKIAQVKQHSEQLRQEVRERTIGYVVAAFGLVASLAWNDAIKALIEYLVPLKANTVLIKFIYAGVLTVAIVLMSVYVLKLTQANKSKDGK